MVLLGQLKGEHPHPRAGKEAVRDSMSRSALAPALDARALALANRSILFALPWLGRGRAAHTILEN